MNVGKLKILLEQYDDNLEICFRVPYENETYNINSVGIEHSDLFNKKVVLSE